MTLEQLRCEICGGFGRYYDVLGKGVKPISCYECDGNGYYILEKVKR